MKTEDDDDIQVTPFLYDPLNDFLFMKYMGEKGDEVQLSGFINAVLTHSGASAVPGIEIIQDRVLTPEILGDKTSVLDVRARSTCGSRVNIEVQLCDKGDMAKRSLYYWSREFTRQLFAGEEYDKLPKVIAINLVNYDDEMPTDKFHSTFHIREDTDSNCILTDLLEIHFINYPKFKQFAGKDENIPLHRWLEFFDKKIDPEKLKKLINMDTAIKSAFGKYVRATSDRDVLRNYQMREQALSDYNSGLASSFRKGIAKGKIEVILNARRKGLSVSDTAEITGLSEAEVFNILNKN